MAGCLKKVEKRENDEPQGNIILATSKIAIIVREFNKMMKFTGWLDKRLFCTVYCL